MERKAVPKQRFKISARAILYAVLLLLVYILQAFIFARFPIFGAKPLLLPLAVVGVALLEGCIRGGTFGLFAGILCDLSMNQATVQFTLVLTGVGIVVGILSDTVLAKGFPSFALCCVLSLVFCALVQAAAPVFQYGANIFAVADTVLDQTICSLLFVLPVYFLVRFISRVLKT